MEVASIYLRPALQASSVQDDTLLVVREHVAGGEALQEAVIVAAVPLADLAVDLHAALVHCYNLHSHQH